ncbi:MAG: aryl-sulfate sulfotransferase [Planctomycetota bacterium]
MLALRAALPLALAATALAQGAPAPGHRYFGALSSTDTFLFDSLGNTIHTWPSPERPGTGVDLGPDGKLYRAINFFATINIPGAGGAIQRIRFDGVEDWRYIHTGPGFTQHHDIEVMPTGNVLLIAWETKTAAEAIAAGRDPSLLPNGVFRPDYIAEVQPTGPNSGQIVWEWHVWDHLIQDFDQAQGNFGSVGAHPELADINYPPTPADDVDFNHGNGIDYDPIHDWIVFSSRQQNEIWIIDHSTTTAEAAGHTGGRWGRGGDILYRWGNPEAYRAGTPADRQLGLQHDPRFIPTGYPGAGNITIFNNNAATNRSAVVEIALPTDPVGNFVVGPNGRFGPTAPVWSYSAPTFFSGFISGAERLPNGNTLICSGAQQWVFEVTPAGQIVWSQTMPGQGSIVFHAHYTERTMFARQSTLSATNGGTMAFDLLTGAAQAGNAYILLGSASGTAPGLQYLGKVLPLNPDSFMLATIQVANSTALPRSLGNLPASGTVALSMTIPGGVLPPGLDLDFACAVLDFRSSLPTIMSNAVRVSLVQ